MSSSPLVVIIGAGPAGLMSAEVLSKAGVRVHVFDHMSKVGRKFLIAGRGGLNLTHSEPFPDLIKRYAPFSPQLETALNSFSRDDLIKWCEDLGQKTFVGTSGRIFPISLKASPLLRAWLRKLDKLQVHFSLSQKWVGWNDKGQLLFKSTEDKSLAVSADATILCLGGASWAKLGSDGAWVEIIKQKDIPLSPLSPANCGFIASWSDIFRKRFEGTPLKPIKLSFKEDTLQGELIITSYGLEGGALYALSRPLREAIQKAGHAILTLDLRPGLSQADLLKRLEKPRGSQSLSTYLKKAAGLSPVAIGLIQENLQKEKDKDESSAKLAKLIKTFPLILLAPSPIDRAISTAGGIRFEALNQDFMFKKIKGLFAAGEMLDWEAPTGGYLLQATFSTAVAAAKGVLSWLEKNQ